MFSLRVKQRLKQNEGEGIFQYLERVRKAREEGQEAPAVKQIKLSTEVKAEATWVVIDANVVNDRESLANLFKDDTYHGIKFVNFKSGAETAPFFSLVYDYITKKIKFTHIVLMNSTFNDQEISRLVALREEVNILEIDNLFTDMDILFYGLYSQHHVNELIVRNIGMIDPTSFIKFLGKNSLDHLTIDHLIFRSNHDVLFTEIFRQLSPPRDHLKHLVIAREKFGHVLSENFVAFLQGYRYVCLRH